MRILHHLISIAIILSLALLVFGSEDEVEVTQVALPGGVDERAPLVNFAQFLDVLRLRYYIYGFYAVRTKDLKVGPQVNIGADGITVGASETDISWENGIVYLGEDEVGIDAQQDIVKHHVNFRVTRTTVTIEGIVRVTANMGGRVVAPIGAQQDMAFENLQQIPGDTVELYYIEEHGKRTRQFTIATAGGVSTVSASIHIGAINEGMLYRMRHDRVAGGEIFLPLAELTPLYELFEAVNAYKTIVRNFNEVACPGASIRTDSYAGVLDNLLRTHDATPITKANVEKLQRYVTLFPRNRDVFPHDPVANGIKQVFDAVKAKQVLVIQAAIAYAEAVYDSLGLEAFLRDEITGPLHVPLIILVSKWAAYPHVVNQDNEEILPEFRKYYPTARFDVDTFKFPNVPPVPLIQGEFELNPHLAGSWNGIIHGIDARKYRIVATIGEQSTGKSTLQNFLYGIPFATKIATRFAETIGISIAPSVLQREADPFKILALDGEGLFGTDRVEREEVETVRNQNMLLCLYLADLFVFRLKIDDLTVGREKFVRIERMLGVMTSLLRGTGRAATRIIFVFQDTPPREQLIDNPDAQLKGILERMKVVSEHPELFVFSTFYLPTPNDEHGIQMLLYEDKIHELSALIHHNLGNLAGGNPTTPIAGLRNHIGTAVQLIKENPDIMRAVEVLDAGMIDKLVNIDLFITELRSTVVLAPYVEPEGEMEAYASDCIEELEQLIDAALTKFKVDMKAGAYITRIGVYGEVNRGSYKARIIEAFERLHRELSTKFEQVLTARLTHLLDNLIIAKINRAGSIKNAFPHIIKGLQAIYHFGPKENAAVFMKHHVDHVWSGIRVKMAELLTAFMRTHEYRDFLRGVTRSTGSEEVSTAFRQAIGDRTERVHRDIVPLHTASLHDSFGRVITGGSLEDMFQLTVNLLRPMVGSEEEAINIAVVALCGISGPTHSGAIMLRKETLMQKIRDYELKRAVAVAGTYAILGLSTYEWWFIWLMAALFINRYLVLLGALLTLNWTFAIIGFIILGVFVFQKSKTMGMSDVIGIFTSKGGLKFDIVKAADFKTILGTSVIAAVMVASDVARYNTPLGIFANEFVNATYGIIFSGTSNATSIIPPFESLNVTVSSFNATVPSNETVSFAIDEFGNAVHFNETNVHKRNNTGGQVMVI